MMNNYKFPAAKKHGQLKEVFPNIFMVTGSVSLKGPHLKYGPLTMTFSRNMYVIREGEKLTIVNSVRLNEAGLAELDALGKVKHIIRIAGYHGMDDPFYKDRYGRLNGATLYSVDAAYTQSFAPDPSEDEIYLKADVILNTNTELPISGANYLEISSSNPKEAILLLDRDGGIAITGDSLQNWEQADEFFNFIGKFAMGRMGFIRACNIGPGWLKFAQPDLNELFGLMDHNFDNVLPSHGAPVLGGASEKYAQRIKKLL